MAPWSTKDFLSGFLRDAFGTALIVVPLFIWWDDIRPLFVALVDFLAVQAG